MENKQCRVCKKVKPITEFYRGSLASRSRFSWACKICFRKMSQKNYERRLLKNPNRIKKMKQKWQEENREKQRLAGAKYRLKVRLAVIKGYGGKCVCCGETEIKFLCIDHIDGGGKKHRKKTKGHTYPDLLKRNFPKGHQVLCHNCNLAKGFYGKCPHQNNETT